MEGKRRRTSSPDPSCVSAETSQSMDKDINFSGGSEHFDHSVKREDFIQAPCHFDIPKERHKMSMKSKYGSLYGGNPLQKSETHLNQTYTQLFIIEGVSEFVSQEHEILQIEKGYKTFQDTPINCNDIFKSLPGSKNDTLKKVKTVLTNGIAGIGKTVSVQKLILDWAEEVANQEVDFIFVLSFRELNLIKDHKYSLHKLLLDFYPDLQLLDLKIIERSTILFIFDGLDESRITLMFSDIEKVSDVNKSSSVGVLMSNLITGDLLPSALIWITTRPAAANKIPSEYIHRLTEIQGFSEPQREEYFKNNISDVDQSSRIISHIRKSRSLYIMCHLPIFCWISSTVLQNVLEKDIPQTPTEMYIQFLLIQTKIKNQKYDEKEQRDLEELLQSSRHMIVKLAELAFKQLMKGNVMFYEEDLRESGIDVTDASVNSGIFTEIFKLESVIHHQKVYCFIHLSFQEFLAAFYVFYCFVNDTSDALKVFDLLPNFYKGVIDVALKSKNGHLDLFLRFLLGISLESNQARLKGLLRHKENSSESIRSITAYIKDKIKHEHGVSADRSINLFLCLLEMKDKTLSSEIQEFLKSDKRTENQLSPAHCSVIAYMLQMSEEVLEELDLRKYNTSDEGKRRLVPAMMNCKKAILSGCMVTEEGCDYLALALSSNPSHMRELDLSYNNPGESGLKMFSALRKNPDLNLEKLNLDNCGDSRIVQGLRKYSCNLTMDLNTANTHLVILEEKQMAKYLEDEQTYPDHAERFQHEQQVLCSETLPERCYWEAEWSGEAYVAVSYKEIRKKGGSDCKFGWNDKSWSLFCTPERFCVWHNHKNIYINVQQPKLSKKVAVYLDRPAGTLSFYSVSDTLTHLHTFNTIFTEPLYAGFAVYGSVSLLNHHPLFTKGC